MPGVVIVGAQWGDEGKGKIVDLLSRQANVVARFQGGNNAGHTLVVGSEKTVLHLVPSGILHEDTVCVVGPGVVVDPKVLADELKLVRDKGLLSNPQRVGVSAGAAMIMPYHKALDHAREIARGDRKIGTTKRGIGPAYEDVASRRSIDVRTLFDMDLLYARLEAVLPEKNALLNYYKQESMSADGIVAEINQYAAAIRPHIKDTGIMVHRALRDGQKVLFEGAQGALLDVRHGTVPFVTSSHTVAGAACTGSGIGPLRLDSVLGIAKAYVTRVGSGPLPTAIGGDLEDQLRHNGGEFGATTGRPRRCAWLDLAALRYAIRINGISELAVTKLDVLSGIDPLKVCVEYRLADGTVTDEMPPTPEDLKNATPVYREVPGWTGDLSLVKRDADLPANARAYLDLIAAETGIPISIISLGPDREETLVRRHPFAG
ncbi:MAG TPA: adenylosuccinate synthase [Myxococcales bacterium]|nr:adenylosuccinate synthase [Myxococcales bacterium]HIN86123.1 adenylosuccinate synthase [Myxococcales bacterium]